MNRDIKQIVKTYAGSSPDLCYYVFDILTWVKEPAKELANFIEFVRIQNSDSSFKLEKQFSEPEVKYLASVYAEYVDGFLASLVHKAHKDGWSTKEFYSALWKFINEDSLFEDTKVRAFVLFEIAQNSLVPYVELKAPITMSDEKFQTIIQKNKDIIIRIGHIMALNHSQKTEIASLILNELQKINQFDAQCVILAVALGQYKERN